MKIYLVSTAGFPNYGDELILKNWVNFLVKKYPECEIWIDVPLVANVNHYFKEKNVRVTSTLWRLVNDIPFNDSAQFYSDIASKISNLGTPNYDLALLNLRNITHFHILGGGYMNGMWVRHTGLVACGTEIKKITQCQSFITGAGLLPIGNESTVLRKLLSEYDYCESRDIEGHVSFGITKGYDDAYLGNITIQNNYDERIIPDVMVCIQRDLVSDDQFYHFIRNIEDRLNFYKMNNLKIGYIEAIPGMDRIAFECLSKYIAPDMFFNAMEVIEKGLPLKKGQHWYTTRFHHHLVASAFGCKGVCFSSKPGYYDIKHSSLLKNGTGWSMWGSNTDESLPQPNINPQFSTVCKNIMFEKKKVANTLYP